MARPGPSMPEEKILSSTSLSGTARPLMGAATRVGFWAAAARSAVMAASRAASSSSPASEARPLGVRA